MPNEGLKSEHPSWSATQHIYQKVSSINSLPKNSIPGIYPRAQVVEEDGHPGIWRNKTACEPQSSSTTGLVKYI